MKTFPKAIMIVTDAENGEWLVRAANQVQTKGAQKRDIRTHLASIGYRPGRWDRDGSNNPVVHARKAA